MTSRERAGAVLLGVTCSASLAVAILKWNGLVLFGVAWGDNLIGIASAIGMFIALKSLCPEMSPKLLGVAISLMIVGALSNVFVSLANDGMFPVSGYSETLKGLSPEYFQTAEKVPLWFLGDHKVMGGSSPGDLLALIGVCVAYFTIGKALGNDIKKRKKGDK